MAEVTVPRRPPEAAELVPLLPVLYGAWADGELTAAELSSLREVLGSLAGLSDDALDQLALWLSPHNPPSPAELAGLRERIERDADGLPAERRRSLAELGLELAKKHGVLAAGSGEANTLRRILAEVESESGLTAPETIRGLVGAPVGRRAGDGEFSVAALQEILDGSQADARMRLRALLSRPEFERPLAPAKEDFRELVLGWLRNLARHGFGGVCFEREYGGEGDMAKFIATFEIIATHDLSLVIKWGVQFGLFGGSIWMLGTRRHHEAYLPAAASVALPGCFAMTELGHGSNVYDIETTARYDAAAGEFVIDSPTPTARKEYIGNAACHGLLATVFTQLEVGGQGHGVHALLVPIRSDDGQPLPGVTIDDCGEKLGLNGVDNGRLSFDNVRVPRENLLDRYAQVTADGAYESTIVSPSKRFFTMLGALVAGRVSIAIGSLSAAKCGLTIAIRYGDRRRQFGPDGAEEIHILDYLAHQRRLLPSLATAYALDFASKYLVERFLARSEDDQREVEGLAAGIKAYASWFAVETLQTGRECCGGQGYLAENRFAALKADIDIFTTFEGDNSVLLQLVAKGLLSEYKRQFADTRPVTMLRFLADRAATDIAERNPIATNNSDPEHLRDAEFQLGAFRYREDRLLGSLARRLRHRIRAGTDSFQAINDCQDHMISLAKAHVERIILEQFVERSASVGDEAVRDVLHRLRSLFALSRIEADRGWFLEAGVLAGAKSEAIRAEVNTLCREVRPDAVGLVDAFGIPDALIGAPIAT